MASINRPRIVIVGAGFAGLAAARALSASQSPHIGTRPQIILLDRNNYHTFTPLLYRIAATEFEPQDVAFSLRRMALPHVEPYLGQVEEIDLDANQVRTRDSAFTYDYLILAPGSTPQINVPGGLESAFALQTLEHAIALRNQILRSLERAIHAVDAVEVRRLLTFVIVGGGASGVELAAAVADFVRRVARVEYPGLTAQIRILLMESGTRLLPRLAEAAGTAAYSRLRELGVQVMLGTRAAEIAPQGVYLRRRLLVPSETVIWAGGVRGHASAQRWALPTAASGQVPVLPTLQVPGHPEVYVAGDLALPSDNGPSLLTADQAIHQGRWAALNVRQQMQGQAQLALPFRRTRMYVKLGRKETIAVSERGVRLGPTARGLWAARHIPGLVLVPRGRTLLTWALKHWRLSGARLIVPAELEVSLEHLELFDGSEKRL